MRSMTGYGQNRAAENGREITIELKSVNHRFLDINLRMPRGLLSLEDPIRKEIAKKLHRGHVDVFFTYRNTAENARVVSVDESLAASYVEAFAALARLPGVRDDCAASLLAALPNVLAVTEAEEDLVAVEALTFTALSGALDSLINMREKEAESMLLDLSAHLSALEEIVSGIEARAPLVVAACQKKLCARIEELLGAPPDPQRLAQEVALIADRAAIDEEIARLKSHMLQYRECLKADGPAGRKLDFLTQEMGREINTIGSKSSDLPIASFVLKAKAELEKLREQVQNIE